MVNNLSFSLSSMDLSALLCSRICHDIISPIGAIHNSLELLDEEGIEDEAIQLIRLSSMNAIARLKFIRLAFCYTGSVHSLVGLDEIKQIIRDFIAIDNRITVFWVSEETDLFRKKSKLLLNLFMIAYASLLKGGEIIISIKDSTADNIFSLKINGNRVRLPEKFIQIMAQDVDLEIDSHSVQLYYTALLADENDVKLSYEIIDDQNVVLSVLTKK
ncbi:hypothetical protein CKC_04720 [Candidatus Liberibacter solanacearum CLso-ZC1]|uniref:Histidine phosphotransferase ChpT C-terminal domain-containing protein n=1 Tax=Liberibacter solanacearum (strain CLso-ZC1) TaxID=658172 RepID=E4UDL5_LIBSC|nr:histidine phosphotransferase family protein [Candidatus Liberibacter solanacearum]ADR52693.1 hypothetical protein CKC_04720 [Candidatus Liberibacter solanacearum CLso-ZC1]